MRAAIASTLTASAQPLSALAVPGTFQDCVQCVWCGKDVAPNEPVIEIGGAIMHDRPCRDDYEAQVYGLDACSDAYGLRNVDPREVLDGRVLDYARSEDRAIIERIRRMPVEVE